MKHQKQDRRVNKSKNAITNTLLRLMETKAVSDITVSELTEAADINRKTFYNHYSSIDSVIDELENNCSNWVLSFVDDVPFETLLDDPAALYSGIAEGLQRHNDLLRLLYDSGIYSRLSNKISANIKEAILKKSGSKFREDFLPTARHLLDFITAGAVSVYNSMYDDAHPATLEEVKEFFEFYFDQSNFRSELRKGLK